MEVLKALNFDPLVWVMEIALFLVLWMVMKAMFFDPILKHLEGRDEAIQTAYHTVEETRQEMEALRADYQTRITQVEADARGRIQTAIREAQAERERIIAESRAQTDAALREGIATMEREKTEALTQLQKDIVGLALTTVTKAFGPSANADALRQTLEQRIAQSVPARN